MRKTLKSLQEQNFQHNTVMDTLIMTKYKSDDGKKGKKKLKNNTDKDN